MRGSKTSMLLAAAAAMIGTTAGAFMPAVPEPMRAGSVPIAYTHAPRGRGGGRHKPAGAKLARRATQGTVGRASIR